MTDLKLVPPGDREAQAEAMIEQAKVVLAFLNSKVGRRYPATTPRGQPTAATLLIYDRIRDGYSIDDMRSVIAMLLRRAKTDQDLFYLRPSTVFRKGYFEERMGELFVSVP